MWLLIQEFLLILEMFLHLLKMLKKDDFEFEDLVLIQNDEDVRFVSEVE
jgi:hypothetical protein